MRKDAAGIAKCKAEEQPAAATPASKSGRPKASIPQPFQAPRYAHTQPPKHFKYVCALIPESPKPDTALSVPVRPYISCHTLNTLGPRHVHIGPGIFAKGGQLVEVASGITKGDKPSNNAI